MCCSTRNAPLFYDCHHAAGHAGEHHSQAYYSKCGMGAPRHMLRPIILLLIAEKPCHGYELIGRIGELELGLDDMDPSIIYRTLRQMEKEGLATTRLDDSGSGPARKVYELTTEGLEVLDVWSVNLAAFVSMLKEFEKRYSDFKRGGEKG